MDAALRAEVRFLTTRLGRIVLEQAGEQAYAAIENFRRLSKQIRQSHDAALTAESQAQAEALSIGHASAVAHAFSLFFHLVNLCEERQRIRRLHEYERAETGAPMSLRHTFHALQRHGVIPPVVEDLVARMHVEPVFTAHPTEAKRRSVVNHILRIGRTLAQLEGQPADALQRAIDPWIEALWLTDEVRERHVTPELEIENVIVHLERNIYDLASEFWQRFEDEYGRFNGERLPESEPFLRFGTWVGADRDGNPNVTPETSLDAARRYRSSVLGYYREFCRRMLGVLSLPAPPDIAGEALRRDLARDLRRFPATRAFENLDQPSELYRRKLRVMMWRLERTREGRSGGYAKPTEFARDIDSIFQALNHHRSPRLARSGPERLRIALDVFGFHGPTMDFRQHSSLTRPAAAAILEAAGLPATPSEARIRSIQTLLARPGNLGERLRVPQAARATLDEFVTLKRLQAGDARAAHRYILSMTAGAEDMWDLLLLGRLAGLVETGARGRLRSSFDVVPLFETFDDLHAGPEILDRLLGDPVYRRLLESRDNFQEVLLGYSDSVKDSGYLAANWALFRAQTRLAEVAQRHGVRLGLFHGKGGTIDRGGGLSYRMVQAQPLAAPSGYLRITEQGEVISLKYSNLPIAMRNLEQLVTSVMDSHLLHPRRTGQLRAIDEWEHDMEGLAAASRHFYGELVYETPGFPAYFYQATPIDLITQLRLGSRPAKRSSTDDLRALRAIPWVFAWTQSRHFLPSWYGMGHALDNFVREHPDGLERLRGMYREWPFFAVLVENAEVSLAKTDLYIAERYAALVRPERLRHEIFGLIRDEYDRTCRLVMEICGVRHLLERQPVLAESIRLRNPYVDPLNYLQIRFLEKWRRSRKTDPDLLHLLQITVGGIAFGMKSTG